MDNMVVVISVKLGVHHMLAHIDEEHLDLQLSPTERHQRSTADALETVHDGRPHEQTAESKPLVAWPESDGRLVGGGRDVLEPGRLHLVRHGDHPLQVPAQDAQARRYVAQVVFQGVRRLWCKGVIVALGPVVEFLDFEVSAWFEMTGRRAAS